MKGFISLNEGKTNAILLNVNYITSVRKLSSNSCYVEYCTFDSEYEKSPYVITRIDVQLTYSDVLRIIDLASSKE